MSNLIFVILIIIDLICFSYAGTIEDVRTKTQWQSPLHSFDNTFIPTITPAKLITYLDKYNKDIIRLQALFNGISSQGLNVWLGKKTNRHKWPSKRYISFSIKDPLKQVSSKDIYLFISKKNPDKNKLSGLQKNAKILITGRVKDTEKGKAWIEVLKIDL